jgi:hypothetical protein
MPRKTGVWIDHPLHTFPKSKGKPCYVFSRNTPKRVKYLQLRQCATVPFTQDGRLWNQIILLWYGISYSLKDQGLLLGENLPDP